MPCQARTQTTATRKIQPRACVAFTLPQMGISWWAATVRPTQMTSRLIATVRPMAPMPRRSMAENVVHTTEQAERNTPNGVRMNSPAPLVGEAVVTFLRGAFAGSSAVLLHPKIFIGLPSLSGRFDLAIIQGQP